MVSIIPLSKPWFTSHCSPYSDSIDQKPGRKRDAEQSTIRERVGQFLMSDSNVKQLPKKSQTEVLDAESDIEVNDVDSGEYGADAQKHKRGIYFLPNLLTTGTLFSGFYSILTALSGNFEAAAIAVFAAMVFDGLDGRVARMTNTQSEFGVQYDSLSDMVAFGVAPAVLVYTWMLEPLGKFGWSVAFIFVSCAALRLARFNVKTATQDKKYFVGLASPPAATLVASMVWSGAMLDVSWLSAIIPAVLTTVVGLLMVSNIRYLSFKDINFAHKVSFAVVLGVCMILAVVMVDPPRVLLVLSFSYALYAPAMLLIKKAKQLSFDNLVKRRNTKKDEENS